MAAGGDYDKDEFDTDDDKFSDDNELDDDKNSDILLSKNDRKRYQSILQSSLLQNISKPNTFMKEVDYFCGIMQPFYGIEFPFRYEASALTRYVIENYQPANFILYLVAEYFNVAKNPDYGNDGLGYLRAISMCFFPSKINPIIEEYIKYGRKYYSDTFDINVLKIVKDFHPRGVEIYNKVYLSSCKYYHYVDNKILGPIDLHMEDLLDDLKKISGKSDIENILNNDDSLFLFGMSYHGTDYAVLTVQNYASILQVSKITPKERLKMENDTILICTNLTEQMKRTKGLLKLLNDLTYERSEKERAR